MFARRVFLAAVTIIGIEATLCSGAQGWVPGGSPVCTALRSQTYPLMATDGAGGTFICWQDARDSTNDRVYLQHLTWRGAAWPGWALNGQPACPGQGAGSQYLGGICSDGAGGVIVVWEYSTSTGFYAQRITPQGTPAAGWPAAGVPLGGVPLGGAVVIPDGQGGAIIGWKDNRYGSHGFYHIDLYAQHIDSSGAVLWTAGGVAVRSGYDEALPAAAGVPTIVSDGASGAIFVFEKSGVYAQRISAAGVPLWQAGGVQLDVYWSTLQGAHAAAPDGQGGAVVSWYTIASSFAQRIGPDGALYWPGKGIVLSPSSHPTLVDVGAGGVFFAWSDYRNGMDADVYAKRVTLEGDVAAGWPPEGRAICTAIRDQTVLSAQSDASGGCVLAWQDWRASAIVPASTYAIRVDSTGAPVVGWPSDGEVVTPNTGSYSPVQMTLDGAGGAVIAWTDNRDYGTTGYDIYAARVGLDGVITPVTLSGLHAEPGEGFVDLQWSAYAEGAPGPMQVLRADRSEGPYMAISQPLDVSPGEHGMTYRDGAVQPGRDYYYKVTLGSAAQGPLHVRTAEAPLALRVVGANPFREATELRYSLPATGRVRIGLFSAQGRLVRRLLDEVRPAGWGRVSLNAAGLPAGVYFARLEASAGKRIVRLVSLK